MIPRHVVRTLIALLVAAPTLAEAGPPVQPVQPVRLRPGDVIGLEKERVLRIDPESGAVTQIFSTVEADPPFIASDLHVARDGSIYLVNREEIWRFDSVRGAVTRIVSGPPIHESARDMIGGSAAGPDGLFYYTRPGPSAGLLHRMFLFAVDPDTGESFLVDSLDLGGYVGRMGFFADGSLAFLFHQAGSHPRIHFRAPNYWLLIDFPTGFAFSPRENVAYAMDERTVDAYQREGDRFPIRIYTHTCEGPAPANSQNLRSLAVDAEESLLLSVAGSSGDCDAPTGIGYTTALLRFVPGDDVAQESYRSERRILPVLEALAVVPEDLALSDDDEDGAPDGFDNCPGLANPSQSDRDDNGTGDDCNDFEDSDGDDHADALDLCPEVYDPTQEDRDEDRIGDVCDPFPDDANHEAVLLAQELQACQIALEGDADGDGIPDLFDACPASPTGAPVDGAGCSRAQFCEGLTGDGFSWTRDCGHGDWLGDENGRGEDCRVRGDRCVSR